METSSNRVLFWSDDFNVNGNVNTSNWKFEIGNGVNGWGNSELEYYTNSNAIVKNGALTIEARKENIKSFKYTSCDEFDSQQLLKYFEDPIRNEQSKEIITMIKDYMEVEFHRSVARRQRNIYNEQTNDAILLSKKILIEFDFKMKIKVPIGPKEVENVSFI